MSIEKAITRKLADLGTFRGATRDELRRIAEAGQSFEVPAQRSLIWERTPADKAYVVLTGTVHILRKGELVATLGAGELVGEAAIVRRKLRSATVVAGEGLEVLHFTREDVERLYADVPAFREALDRSADEHAA